MTDEDMFEMQRAAAEMEKEIEKLKDRIAKLTGENEAYKAMIDTYRRKEREG
jgi:cell division protein FtsL